jgi:hypothetical protein
VPGMPRRLLQQVHQHPAQVDLVFPGEPPAGLVQARRPGDGVGSCPGGAVGSAPRRRPRGAFVRSRGRADPPQALARANAELDRSGVPFDLTQLKPERLEDLVEQLDEVTLEIDQPDAKVRVFCE